MLELGGKSPHIVFDDVDLEKAMPVLVGACMQNAGQICSAASRVLVQKGIYDEVKRRMIAIYEGLTVGPAVESHYLGPVLSKKQHQIVQGFIDRGRAELITAAQGKLHADAPAGGNYILSCIRSLPHS